MKISKVKEFLGSRGLNVSDKDLRLLEDLIQKSSNGELVESDLENISGGISKNTILVSSAIALATVGAVCIASAGFSNEMIGSDNIPTPPPIDGLASYLPKPPQPLKIPKHSTKQVNKQPIAYMDELAEKIAQRKAKLDAAELSNQN